MSIDKATHRADASDEYTWLRDGNLSNSREDRIAEAVALIALLFSLGIGIVIALLPVSAGAATLATPSLALSAFKIVPAQAGRPEKLVPATEVHAGDQLEYQAVYSNPTPTVMHH